MHTPACTGLIEWLQVFSTFCLTKRVAESLAGHRGVFAQSLCNVKVGQIVVHLVMLLWWWGTRCACPCTGYSITSRVPRLCASQAAVAASSPERLVEGRGMGLGTFLLTGVGEKMFCSMRFEKYAHSCLNKNLSS